MTGYQRAEAFRRLCPEDFQWMQERCYYKMEEFSGFLIARQFVVNGWAVLLWFNDEEREYIVRHSEATLATFEVRSQQEFDAGQITKELRAKLRRHISVSLPKGARIRPKVRGKSWDIEVDGRLLYSLRVERGSDRTAPHVNLLAAQTVEHLRSAKAAAAGACRNARLHAVTELIHAVDERVNFLAVPVMLPGVREGGPPIVLGALVFWHDMPFATEIADFKNHPEHDAMMVLASSIAVEFAIVDGYTRLVIEYNKGSDVS